MECRGDAAMVTAGRTGSDVSRSMAAAQADCRHFQHWHTLQFELPPAMAKSVSRSG